MLMGLFVIISINGGLKMGGEEAKVEQMSGKQTNCTPCDSSNSQNQGAKGKKKGGGSPCGIL